MRSIPRVHLQLSASGTSHNVCSSAASMWNVNGSAVSLQVCDALANPVWSDEVGFVFNPDDDGFQPGETADWPTYIAKQRQPYAWGGWREVRVFQELLDVRLVIYDLDKEVRLTHHALLLTYCINIALLCIGGTSGGSSSGADAHSPWLHKLGTSTTGHWQMLSIYSICDCPYRDLAFIAKLDQMPIFDWLQTNQRQHWCPQTGAVLPNTGYGPHASVNECCTSKRSISLLFSGHSHYDLLLPPADARRLASSNTSLLYLPAKPLL